MADVINPAAKPLTTVDTERKTEAALVKAKSAAHPLLFQARDGLDKPTVMNTFRLGKKWADRVKLGDSVKLEMIQDERNEDLGTAEVTGVITGNWDEVKHLASDNHAFGGFPPTEAAAMLHDELKRLYGGEFNSRSVLTVLYFKVDK